MRLKVIIITASMLVATGFWSVDFVTAASCSSYGGSCSDSSCPEGTSEQSTGDVDYDDCNPGDICCISPSTAMTLDESVGKEILNEPTAGVEESEATEDVSALKIGANSLNPMNYRQPTDLLSRAINAMIGFMGSIALLLYIYAGFIWMSASGNSDKVTKAKNILVWTSLGIVAMAASYMITRFVIDKLG